MRVHLGLVVYFLALLCVMGCGAGSKVSKARLGNKTAYESNFCTVGSNSYEIGESFLDEYECNTCICQRDSVTGKAEALCTLLACY